MERVDISEVQEELEDTIYLRAYLVREFFNLISHAGNHFYTNSNASYTGYITIPSNYSSPTSKMIEEAFLMAYVHPVYDFSSIDMRVKPSDEGLEVTLRRRT